ncbi:MAG: inositol monophosphatase family protein [Candidatus Brocadiia bacterium]
MLETAIRAAREAGRLLQEGSRGEIRVEHLAQRDVKLAMDKKAEEVILRIVREKFPGHAILSEECGAVGPKSDYLWVIDPLDGTVNYSRRIPLWGTSVALLHQGREIVGVIFDPIHGELYHSEEGQGAFLNGKRIRVSERVPLSAAMIAFGFSSREEQLRRGLATAAQLPLAASKVRGMGSAVLHLAYVACGRLDGFFEFGINQWDIAAGIVLIREAGGKVFTRTLPDRSIDLVCSNGLIHDEFMKQAGG